MKKEIGILIALFLAFGICINSCKKNENIDQTGRQLVTFSFEQIDLGSKSSINLKLSYLKEDSRYIVITIEKSSGDKVYESKRLELYNFGGSFISQSLSLEVDGSPYKLTEFLVLDKNYKTIFATPLEGSALAYLVADPLPISFTVNKNKITNVVPEVLSIELAPIKDFGYLSFDLNLITPIRFLSDAQGYNPYSKNWEPIKAGVIIKGDPGDTLLYNDSIAAKTDTIKIKDGYDNYKISVSKVGYVAKDTLLTNVQLKTYLNNPLIFLLKNAKETVTDIDGNVYNVVTIGTQVWMVENLKVTRYRNGHPILNGIDGTKRGAYMGPFTLGVKYDGILYNWFSVIDSRDIAPVGWHIPTDAEWTTLTAYCGGDSIAGGKLKEAGTTHWSSPNTGATNETGFTALPGRFIVQASPIPVNGIYSYWWSSSIDPVSGKFLIRSMWNTSKQVSISLERSVDSQYSFYSVRCIKD